MWPVFLMGGLATIGVLFVAFPLMIVRGIYALAELLSRTEVEDDET